MSSFNQCINQFTRYSRSIESNIKIDAQNIEHIVGSVLNEDDELINKALFIHSKADRSAYGDEIEAQRNRSIDSFISYVSDVVNVYRQTYSVFMT